MNVTMRLFFIVNHLFFSFIYFVDSAPQQEPEINDQFEEYNHTEVIPTKIQHVEAVTDNITASPSTENPETVKYNIVTEISDEPKIIVRDTTTLEMAKQTPGFMLKLFVAFKKPIMEFLETPKVKLVLKNVGTCIVNGAMEIVSFYFPAPLIPLIASAAGMVIPFEPVVMLRKRMPVDSYRRAFKTAVNSFMGTFERFKPNRDSAEDPYMTRRFNRRFMGGNSKDY